MKYEIDARRRTIRITPTREEDLYFTYLLIDLGDIIRGWTVREYRPEGAKEGERVKMFLAIKVEALEYHKFRGSLRVRGTVVDIQEGVEGVKGRRHTFEVTPGREVYIEKREEIPIEAVVEVLNLAKTMLPRVLLASVDDEEAVVAYITAVGIEILQQIYNRKNEDSLFEEYLDAVCKAIEIYTQRLKPDKVVVTGPGMVIERIRPGEKIPQSVGGVAGVYEYMRRGLYDELKIEMGIEAYHKFMQRLATDRESVAIGIEETEEAAAVGRVEILLILDIYIKESPARAWHLINKVLKARGKVYIIREDLEVGKGLAAMGGAAALLRW
ncbi:MAG: mRNA surveillance protein Pelota [Pyrobaculum sp.]